MEYLVDIFHKEAYANHFLGGKSEVVIPAFITYNDKKYAITKISKSCFKNSPSLLRVDIPEGVTELGDFCFYNCPSLTSISIPSTVRELGMGCFNYCRNLKEVAIPEGVTKILKYCFSGCNHLNNIVIPEGVTKISKCFGWCTSIKNISLPSTLEEIGDRCFYNCYSLMNMNIPSSVKKFGEKSFFWCYNWTGDIVIPEGTTQIPRSCFEGCHALSSISLPSTLQQLDSCAIVCSARMKEMKLRLADVPENFAEAINHGEWKSWPGYYSQASTKNFLTLYVPASSVEAYKQAVGQYFKAILPLAETGINQPSLDGITISASYGNVVISGLQDGTPVKLYAVDGKYLGESIASQGSVFFNCCNEKMVIAKIGSKSMKIAVSR